MANVSLTLYANTLGPGHFAHATPALEDAIAAAKSPGPWIPLEPLSLHVILSALTGSVTPLLPMTVETDITSEPIPVLLLRILPLAVMLLPQAARLLRAFFAVQVMPPGP